MRSLDFMAPERKLVRPKVSPGRHEVVRWRNFLPGDAMSLIRSRERFHHQRASPQLNISAKTVETIVATPRISRA